MKPLGLWYSFGMEWLEWCNREGMQDWVANKNWFKVELDCKYILQITNAVDLMRFARKYSMKHNDLNYIDWTKVANDYSGIEIAPYQYQLRLDPKYIWYYGWDVASGCIWDSKAIKNIVKITKHEKLLDNSKKYDKLYT